MTLQELFDSLAAKPIPVVVFFILLPIAAAIGGKIASNDEVRQSPWNYFYATLVYLTCVPGIFALVLCFYTLSESIVSIDYYYFQFQKLENQE